MASVEVGPSQTQFQNETGIQNPLDEAVNPSVVSAPPNESQNAISRTKVPQVWLLNAGDAETIKTIVGEEQKFWLKIHGNVRKCQDDQRRLLEAMDKIEEQRQAEDETEPGARDKCSWQWDDSIKAAKGEFESLSQIADEITSLNKEISKHNSEAGRQPMFGQVRPWPYLKPILSRPEDYEAIEANPAILCLLLKAFFMSHKLQRLREDFYTSKQQSSSGDFAILKELKELDSEIGRHPQIKEARQREDPQRAEYKQRVDELNNLRNEEEEIGEMSLKSGQTEAEQQQLTDRVGAFDKAKAQWVEKTKWDYEEYPDEYKEFASIYLPDQGERLNLDDELLEPPETEIINEMTGVVMDEVHIEYKSKLSSETLPPSIRKCLDIIGRREGPLHKWVCSVKEISLNEVNGQSGDQEALKELNAGCYALLQECDKLGIDRAEFSIGENHIRAFIDMIQQAEAAYKDLEKDPENETLQQQYSLIRQRAAIWMENNKFPSSFVDILVPPETLVVDSINAGRRGAQNPTLDLNAGRSDAQNPLLDPNAVRPDAQNPPPDPSTVRPDAQSPPPDPSTVRPDAQNPPSDPNSKGSESSIKDTAGPAAADGIPLDDSEDQCAPIVECPPMTVFEDGIYKKVVDVIKIGFMVYGVLKWPGSNPEHPNLFQHELVPKTYLGDAVPEFVERYPGRKFVVASKPTKDMKWDTAQIGGSASVRRDPNLLYKINAMTYDWVKFKGQKLQKFRRSDLINRYNRRRVEAKINDYLEKAGQKPPVPPSERVFVKELPDEWRETATNAAKKSSRKRKAARVEATKATKATKTTKTTKATKATKAKKAAEAAEETEEEGESLHSDEECSEEDDEGDVSDLIDDESEEDVEETKRKNQELYWKQKREELDAEEKAWKRKQQKKPAKEPAKGKKRGTKA